MKKLFLACMLMIAFVQGKSQDTIVDLSVVLIEDSMEVNGHIDLHLSKGTGTEVFGGIIKGLGECFCQSLEDPGNDGGEYNEEPCDGFFEFPYHVELNVDTQYGYFKPIFIVPIGADFSMVQSVDIEYKYYTDTAALWQDVTLNADVTQLFGGFWYEGQPVSGVFWGANMHEHFGDGSPISFEGAGNGYQEIEYFVLKIGTVCGVFGAKVSVIGMDISVSYFRY